MRRTVQGTSHDRQRDVDDEILPTLRRLRADQDLTGAGQARPAPVDSLEQRRARLQGDEGWATGTRGSMTDTAADTLIDLSCLTTEPVPSATELKARKIRGNRGVDTLLRNAYRAQLDMLALAATKANIMISLNGLLMSMLVLSGTHFLSVNPLFVIPIVLFFLGCATATVFAVLAARPDVSRRTFQLDDFERDEARLLVFEDFSDLEEPDYVDSMSRLLRDPTRIYRSMLAHVHEMGTMADRKFQRLYYSYTVFMAGFVLAASSLIIVQSMAWFALLT